MILQTYFSFYISTFQILTFYLFRFLVIHIGHKLISILLIYLISIGEFL